MMTAERIANMNKLRSLEMRIEGIECSGELTLLGDLEAIHSLMAERDAVLAELGGHPTIGEWADLNKINRHAAEGLRFCRFEGRD